MLIHDSLNAQNIDILSLDSGDTMDEEEEEKERKKFIHRRETRYV